MVNISNLVFGVKEKKEFDIFDKINFICKYNGKKSSGDSIEVKEYVPYVDNLKLFLIQGELNGSLFQHALVKDKNDFLYFEYWRPNILESQGRVDKYIPGKWEKLVYEHYKMSLSNCD